jgi:Fic family protein
MDRKDFLDEKTGYFVATIQNCVAFVPAPLPPPNLDLAPLIFLISRANRALGELSGVGRTLHNPYLLIRPFMRREAVASSKIEGTVTTLSELFLFEIDEQTSRAPADAREVFNYVRSLESSLSKLNTLPISSRLLREAHETLLTNVSKARGATIVPGEFKRDQNWIGARLIQNARFIPPPPIEAANAMSDLEKYINNDADNIPLLIKIALVHYQFETIHPFPDGNGRVGRLLISLMLMLCEKRELSQPLLYLSSYFEAKYEEYIDKMLSVSKRGTWNDWIEFFLIGIEETCNDAIKKAQNLQDLQSKYYKKIQEARSSALLGKIIDILFESPAVTIPFLSHRLNITYNASKNNIAKLVKHEILKPSTRYIRPAYWIANEIIDVISK